MAASAASSSATAAASSDASGAASPTAAPRIYMALPKGHMKDGVFDLLSGAGVKVSLSNDRAYRPTISWGNFDAKLLKPQNILGMLKSGSRDVGFAGYDWVHELGFEGEVVELLDTGLDPVRIVAASIDPDVLKTGVGRGGRKLIVASEYIGLAEGWIKSRGLDAVLLRTWGATESLPPEDADVIVDNTATGDTLRANGLHIVDVLLTSSTRLFASKAAVSDPAKKAELDKLTMLLNSVISGRSRKMVTFNLPKGHDGLEEIIARLPCARAPTVSELFHGGGYAIQIAVKDKEVPSLIPLIKEWGGTDVIVTAIQQIVS